jgi:hypothetical protein
MTVSRERAEAYERWQQRREESELSLIGMLVEVGKLWSRCDRKACRRGRCCTDVRHCRERYDKQIVAWRRETLVPYMRERYPTVKWGAGAGIVETQLEAALEAEKDLTADERLQKCGEALARAEALGRGETGGPPTSAARADRRPDCPAAESPASRSNRKRAERR